MMNHTIITIGRQFGSGGHEVGNRLAERLNIPLYDHNLIRMAARDLGISNEDAGRVDETRLGNVLSSYYIGMGDYTTFMLSPEAEKPLINFLTHSQQSSASLRNADRESLWDAAQIMFLGIIQML